MFRLRRHEPIASDLFASQLYDQDGFYQAFLRDLDYCRQELIIESPFITKRRMRVLLPVFQKLRQRGVRIVINTRDPAEHQGDYVQQASDAVEAM